MKRKVCLAPDEHRLPCGGSIIQAHTISRSQLQRIAENGHIYAFKVSVAQLMKNDGQLTISKIGISDFSVLNCFCQKHDMAIFSHIENDQLTFDQHQLLLLYFRALGAELYKATAALENVKLHQREVSRRPGPRGARLRELLSGHLYIKEIQVRDIALHFTRASDALSEGRYDHVSALVVHFKNMPSMMTAGAVPPEFDYEGKRLQDFAEEVLVEFPSLYRFS